MEEVRAYLWPKKNKIAAYKNLRKNGRRIVQIRKKDAFLEFRATWQTDYGQKFGGWHLIPGDLIPKPATIYASISETLYQNLKRNIVKPKGLRVRLWEGEDAQDGTILDVGEFYYSVVPDDDMAPTKLWPVSQCELLKSE